MDMVEKTRRSLTVLRRCQEADREELNHWIRCYSDSEEGKKGPTPISARSLNSCSGPEGSQLGVYQGRTWRTCSERLLALHSLSH